MLQAEPINLNAKYLTGNDFVKVDLRSQEKQALSNTSLEYTPPGDEFITDDGKISAGDKAKNFAKGIIAPITMMFSSPKNFLIGAASITGGAVLIAATGGALAPVLVAGGIIGGGIQFAKSAYNASSATTDDEARAAWQGMGTGTTAVAGSILGSKAALKGAGVDTSKMNVLSATAECFKQVPKGISNSFKAFTSGAFITNIKNAFHIKNKKQEDTKNPEKPQTEQEKPKPEPEPKAETKPEPKAEAKPEPKAEPKTETGPEPKAGANPEPKAEVKPKTQDDTNIGTQAETRTKTEPNPEPKAEVKTETKKTQETPEVKITENPQNPQVSEDYTIALTTDSYKEYMECIQRLNKMNIDQIDDQFITFLKELEVPKASCFKGYEGKSFYEYLFDGLEQNANITPDTVYYHGTYPENVVSIVKNGFDTEFSNGLNDAGRGIYTTLESASQYTKEYGATIKFKLKPDAKIASMAGNNSKTRISNVQLFLNAAKETPYNNLDIPPSKYLPDVIKGVITRHIQKMGYSGLAASSRSAGCDFVVIYDTSKIQIL